MLTCDACLNAKHYRCRGNCACRNCVPTSRYKRDLRRRTRLSTVNDAGPTPAKPRRKTPSPSGQGRGRRQTLPAATRVAIAERIREGHNLSAVAREFNTTRDKVRTIAKNAGLTPQRGQFRKTSQVPEEDQRMIVMLLLAGETQSGVARKTPYSRDQVRYIAKVNGLEAYTAGGRNGYRRVNQ